MASHASPPLLGSTPLRKPNQHHLPPLLPTSLHHSTETLSALGPRATATAQHSFVSSKVFPYSGFFSHNRCSVSTVGSVEDADLRHGGAHGNRDVISYIVEHQLPKLFNTMIEDLLRERPEEDVDAWMTRWFEDAYERHQREEQRRLAQQGMHRLRQRVIADGGSSISTEIFSANPTVINIPRVSSLPFSSVLTVHPVGNKTDDVVSTRQRSDADPLRRSSTRLLPLPISGRASHSVSTASVHTESLTPPDTSVMTTVFVQRTPSFSQESRPSLAEEGEQIVVRMPCAVDCRQKSRPLHTVDVGNGGSTATPGRL